MNALNHTQQVLGISRRELCRRIGISHQSGIDYSLGRKPVPRTVVLACLALENALELNDGKE